MSKNEELKPPDFPGPSVDPNQRLDATPPVDEKYRCGTLVYTKAGLFVLFSWLIWGGVCFNLFEGAGGPNILGLYLQENFHVSNLQVNIMFNVIPMGIGTFMTPIVSFKSDRTRSRFGRRMPYILFTAPFLVLFAAAIGFSDDIFAFCKTNFSESASFLTPYTVAMIIISFLTIGFSFFNEFVGTVFYYVVPDVVPPAFIGRFQGISQLVGQACGMGVGLWIAPYQLTHIKAIHVGLAIIYLISFTLLCLRVKEGQYPPVTDVVKGTSRWSQVKLYFRECFTHPIFILFYLVTAVTGLSKGINPSGVFGLHLGQHQAQATARGDVRSMAMTGDGKVLVSGDKDGTVQVWSSADMKDPQLRQTLGSPHGGPAAVAVAADGKKAVTGSASGVVEVWDVSTGQKLSSLPAQTSTGPARPEAPVATQPSTQPAPSKAVRALAISPDGQLLASAGADGMVRVWNLADGSLIKILKGHEGEVHAVAFSSDSARLASGGGDKKIILWDARAGTLLKTLEGSPGPVYAVAFSPVMGPPDRSKLPEKGWLQTARDESAGFLKQVFTNESLYDTPYDQLCSVQQPDGWVIAGGRDGAKDTENSRVRIWDVDKGECLHVLKGHKQAVTSVVYKPDIRAILSGSLDTTVRLWQPWAISSTADDQSFKTFSGYTHAVTAIALQDQGVKLVNASSDGTLHVWDIDQGISLFKGGRQGVFFSIFGMLLALPIGWLVDKTNPIRLTLFASLLIVPIPFMTYLWFHDYTFGFWTSFFRMPFGMIAGMAGLPLMILIYPKTKYGQMCSAGAIIKQVFGAVAGPLGAILMDYLTAKAMNTDAFRYGFLIQGFIAVFSLMALLGVYYYWKKLGGKNYVAPEAA